MPASVVDQLSARPMSVLRAYKAACVAQPTVRIIKEGDLIAIPSPSDLPDIPEPNSADAADQKRPA